MKLNEALEVFELWGFADESMAANCRICRVNIYQNDGMTLFESVRDCFIHLKSNHKIDVEGW